MENKLGAILTMLAQDGGTYNVDGKTFTVTVVEGEKQQEQPTDYSHLVGKWVKCVSKDRHYFTDNKWYKCEKIDKDGELMFIDDEGGLNGYIATFTTKHFDLTNPLPYNPDTRIPLPDGVEFKDIMYGLAYKMNDFQSLGYHKHHKHYFVTSIDEVYEVEPCHLEPCEYGELKDGEWFVLNSVDVYLKAKYGDVYADKEGNVTIYEQIEYNTPVHRVVRDNQ